MPSKKKSTKVKDFSKKKLKVGKVKPKANNSTNVSFQSKTIQLQSKVVLDPRSEEFEKSFQVKFTFLKEKLSHLQSNNESVRIGTSVTFAKWMAAKTSSKGIIIILYAIDSLKALKELFQRDPLLFVSGNNLGLVCDSLSKVIADNIDSIGKDVYQLASDIFDLVPSDAIQPFFNMFLVYCGSAISHISEKVRIRGVRFLGLLCIKYPTLVEIHGKKILPHFLLVMSSEKSNGKSVAFHFNASGQTGLLMFRCEILEIFQRFCSLIIPNQDPKIEKQILITGASHLVEWNAHTCFYPLDWHVSMDAKSHPIFDDSQHDAINLQTKQGKKSLSYQSQSLLVMNGLLSKLVDFWIESSEAWIEAPSINVSQQLKICKYVLLVISHFWPTYSIANDLINESKLMMRHISPYFPFGKAQSCREKVATDDLLEMNLAFTVTAFHILQYLPEEEKKQLENVIQEFYIVYFTDAHHMADPAIISTEALKHLQKYTSSNDRIFKAVMNYQVNAKTDAVAYSSFQLVLKLNKGYENKKFYITWLKGLAKKLWQLKSSHLDFSRAILKGFTRTARQGKVLEFIQSLDTLLIPIFMSLNGLPSVFQQLPEDIQHSILGLVYYIPELGDNFLQNIIRSCLDSKASTTCYFWDVLHNRANIPHVAMLKTELSLLIGYSSERLNELRKQHSEILKFKEYRSNALSEMIPLTNAISAPDLLIQALGNLIQAGIPKSSFCMCLSIMCNVKKLELPEVLLPKLYKDLAQCYDLEADWADFSLFQNIISWLFTLNPDLSLGFDEYCKREAI